MFRLPYILAFIIAGFLGLPEAIFAQSPTGTPPRVPTLNQDSSYYTLPPLDTQRVLDSLYRVRKAMIERWAKANAQAAHPQDDFLSIYAALGGYMKLEAKDLNQFFSERAERPDPLSDRENLSTIDRAFIVSGQAQLSRTWGIYVEYDFTARYMNTIIDAATIPALAGAEETLNFTQHALVTGGMVVLYSGRFYRLRANGGLGAVLALTSEAESGSGATRSASAVGYQFNIDLLNDFRFMDRASFSIDLLSRSVATGALKTSDGKTLDTPFGYRTASLSIAPHASNLAFGFAAGVVYYF